MASCLAERDMGRQFVVLTLRLIFDLFVAAQQVSTA